MTELVDDETFKKVVEDAHKIFLYSHHMLDLSTIRSVLAMITAIHVIRIGLEHEKPPNWEAQVKSINELIELLHEKKMFNVELKRSSPEDWDA